MVLAPVISLCHGGGPMPLLGHPGHKYIIESMQHRIPSILKLNTPEKPKAVLLVTAHWEEWITTISSASKHDLLYDYGGFPPEAYKIKYNAPGDPAVAQMVADVLGTAGIGSKLDKSRGWDHGVFVPMKLIDPSAEIPIVQMSVLSSQSAKDLFEIGTALQPLRESGIAIIGSGSPSFHNLRVMFSGGTKSPEFLRRHEAWAGRLDESIRTAHAERGQVLEQWRQWEHADMMHPPGEAEHLSPLIVCTGAGGESVISSWIDNLMGVNMKSYYWS